MFDIFGLNRSRRKPEAFFVIVTGDFRINGRAPFPFSEADADIAFFNSIRSSAMENCRLIEIINAFDYYLNSKFQNDISTNLSREKGPLFLIDAPNSLGPNDEVIEQLLLDNRAYGGAFPKLFLGSYDSQLGNISIVERLDGLNITSNRVSDMFLRNDRLIFNNSLSSNAFPVVRFPLPRI